MVEVVQVLSEELSLANLERATCILQQCEHFVKVLGVVFELSGKDQHVVKVHQGRLHLDTGEYDVLASLKSGWVVAQSEMHADKTKGTTKGYERRLGTVILGNMHLPVSPVGIEREVYRGITKAVDAVVHARNCVRIRDCGFFLLPVIDAESRSSIFLSSDDDR